MKGNLEHKEGKLGTPYRESVLVDKMQSQWYELWNEKKNHKISKNWNCYIRGTKGGTKLRFKLLHAGL